MLEAVALLMILVKMEAPLSYALPIAPTAVSRQQFENGITGL